MITIEKTSVDGFEPAFRGMRNPKNSWNLSDSEIVEGNYILGEKDSDLAMRLNAGGPVHAKYRRMIVVWADIVAPLYWWKEFDTYKVGTVADSCSTMHKIASKPFEMGDFSTEHLIDHRMRFEDDNGVIDICPVETLENLIKILNVYRLAFNQTKKKEYWWQLIQLLPSSYNQRRTVMLNYEVLHNMYISRKDHKLDEWHKFCDWIKELPYSELICGDA